MKQKTADETPNTNTEWKQRPYIFTMAQAFLTLTFLILALLFLDPAAHAQTASGALVRPPDVLTDEDDLSIYEADQEPIPQIRRKKPPVKNQTGTYYIEHPNAKRGLIKIDKERVYHYKVKSSEQKNAGSFRIGTYTPSELANPNNSDLTFDSIYDETNFPILLYDHEWQFFQRFGKLSWKLGGGFYLAQGRGQFENINDDPSARPRERFTLFVFPISIGLTYRLHYWKNQWVVPYMEGGADGFLFAEYRDDDQNPSMGAAYGAAPAVHYSVGGSISLGKDARSFLDLDREYGINAIFLTVEYRQYFALSDKYDFSGDAISGGVTAEF